MRVYACFIGRRAIASACDKRERNEHGCSESSSVSRLRRRLRRAKPKARYRFTDSVGTGRFHAMGNVTSGRLRCGLAGFR